MGMEIGALLPNQVSTSSTITKKTASEKKAEGGAAIVKAFQVSKKKKKKKKRLSYNFKRVSNQILMSKNTLSASKALNKARGSYMTLLMKKKGGEYNDNEIKSALEHAREMVRIAKKRKRHMEEEEFAVNNGETQVAEGMEMEEQEDENSEENQDVELSSDELEAITQELKEMTKDSLEEALKELADELISTTYTDMSKEEIDELKRKHRQDELKEIMEADMKYLKALFDRLQKEKQQSVSSVVEAFDTSDNPSPVSLELGGVEVPVQVQQSAAEVVEGAAVDVSV